MEFYFKSRQAKIVVTVFDDELPTEADLVSRGTRLILKKIVPQLFDWVLNTLSQMVILASDRQLAVIAPVLTQRSAEGLEEAFVATEHYQEQIKGGRATATEIGQAESQLAAAEESGPDLDPYAEFLDTLFSDDENDLED